MGVFPSNRMSKFISHLAIVSSKKGKYPFIIANTDSSEKGATHWWSILNIEPKPDIFFFDSLRIDGLKHVITQDDRKIIEKVLFGKEKMSRTDCKITLYNIRFNLSAYKILSKRELATLSDTANDFIWFILAFGNKVKLRNFVNMWVVEGRVQDLNSVLAVYSNCTFTTI